ncbi:cytochrome P450 [Cyathus striatus]|nr:cytochrome P450 [Cyathus striatus]
MSYIAVLPISFGLFFTYKFLTRDSLDKTALPGPAGSRIIGNLKDIPADRPWIKFTEWGREFGNIIQVRLPFRKLIIVNSYDLALELFESRSSIYSDRPRRPMADMSGFGNVLLFQDYGEPVRKARKMMHADLTPRGIINYQTILEEEAKLIAKRSLDSPNDLVRHISDAAASSILMITYGIQIKNENDPIVVLAKKVMDSLSDLTVPTRYVVNSIPILRVIPSWMPGADFQRIARMYSENLHGFMNTTYSRFQKQMESGNERDSFVLRQLQKMEGTIDDESIELLKWTAGGSGTDTCHADIYIAMILNPDAQKKAHEELDKLIGHNELPKFADRSRLPYLDGLIKEVYRWRPAAPLISHRTRTSDMFQDAIYHLTPLLSRTYGVSFTHDEGLYPDPEKFNPERYMNDKACPDPRTYVFGFGRRSCPGINLADAFVYIVISNILAAFEILPALGEDRESIYQNVKYSTGAVSHPSEFKFRLVPRSLDLVRTIEYGSQV